MKSQLLKFLIVATIVMAGCSKDQTTFDDTSGSGDIADMTSVGYLSFEDSTLNVDTDMEGFVDEETSDLSAQTRSTAEATEEVAIEDYAVILSRESDSEIIKEWTYGEIKALTAPIEFDAGYYVINAYSEKEIPSSQWNHEIYTSPVYKVTVGDSNITTVPSITCSLATIKAQVSVSSDLKELFDLTSEEYPFLVTLSLGEESVAFTETIMDNKDAIYFAPQESNTTLKVTLTGLFNAADVGEADNYVPLEWVNNIENVAAGQWRRISIKVDNYHEGQIEIGCVVEGWTTEETLGVEISSQTFNFAMAEETIPDKDNETTDVDAPVLTLSNMDVTDTYYITSSTFDTDAEIYYPTYKATVTPVGDSTVESAYIEISSTSTSLMTKLVNDGYTDGKMILWGDGAISTSYINMRESGSVLTATLTYSGATELYKYSGTHTLKVVVTDSEGRRLFTTLTINVVSSSSTAIPTIVYVDGDFNTPIDLDTTPDGGYNVVVDMTSYAGGGFTNLYLAIDSPVLTESDLKEMNLSTNMDVANVEADSGMEATLNSLGIPCGSAVLNQSFVQFDISQFMGLLGGLGTGTTTFTITVVDANGESSETLTAIRTVATTTTTTTVE